MFPTHYSAPSSGIFAHPDFLVWFASHQASTFSFIWWVVMVAPVVWILWVGYKKWKATRQAAETPEDNSDNVEGPGQSRLSSGDAASAFGAARTGKAVDEEMERRAALRKKELPVDSDDIDDCPEQEGHRMPMSDRPPFLLTGSGQEVASVHCASVSEVTLGDARLELALEEPKDTEGSIVDSVLAGELA